MQFTLNVSGATWPTVLAAGVLLWGFHEAQSDLQGQFRFSGLEAGAHLLKVWAKGFATYEQSLDLQDRESAPLSIMFDGLIVEEEAGTGQSEN